MSEAGAQDKTSARCRPRSRGSREHPREVTVVAAYAGVDRELATECWVRAWEWFWGAVHSLGLQLDDRGDGWQYGMCRYSLLFSRRLAPAPGKADVGIASPAMFAGWTGLGALELQMRVWDRR
jgi:hypothetical protein